MLEKPRHLGRYELIDRIAVGGMGEIYLAKSRGAAGFEKTVIIKKILEHLAEEEEFVSKFLDEGRIVVNLTHSNIVPVFDMGAEDGEYFIAMEYVRGRDLRDILKRSRAQQKPVPLDIAIHTMAKVCAGLDYAHRKKGDDGRSLDIVHRDISPSNIMVSREGEVKVIDFGIARAASRAGRTASGRIQGKICYMSPEQASGRALDARSDIFSTGVVLYEMLTGERPFQGDSDMQSLDLVRRCDFALPSSRRAEIPSALDRVVSRAMAPTPEDRYQSIRELHVDLLEFAHSQGRSVMSQEVAEFLSDLFPEGVERQRLREAREARGGRALGLEEALNAEFDRLADPLETTAGHGSTPAGASDNAHTATLASHTVTPPAPGPAPSEQRASSTHDIQPDADTTPSEGATDQPPTKRVVALALLLGALTGAGLLAYSSPDQHTSTTEPDAARPQQASSADEPTGPSPPRPAQSPAANEPQRTFFVSTTPPGAALKVDNRPIGAAPQAVRLTQRTNNKAIVTASRTGCTDTSKIILFARDDDVVRITLDCDDASAPSASAQENADEPSPPPLRARSRRVEVRTQPPGARLFVDGSDVGRAPFTRTWRLDRIVELRAELSGYLPVNKSLRVGSIRSGELLLTLEQAPMGCVRVNLVHPQVLTLEVDGRTIEANRADRIELPAGLRRIVATNQSAGFRETFTVDVPPGERCALLETAESAP